ncbi:CsbD family protein [Geomonas subterranea]|uniref:CsbD family protein n=1 Tax=Geomonas subterranea TaxID=2847989 RepID=UPI001EEFC4AB|nr:CsbD family protein [Geomonas subterranea]
MKETTGKIFGNVSLEAEGKAEKIAGKVQKHAGKAEKNIEEDLDVKETRRGKY